MADDPREQLRIQQSNLVAALIAVGPAPGGFDKALLATASRSLVNKRARCVLHAWPILFDTMGVKFFENFQKYASQLQDNLPTDDALQFMRFLHRLGVLPDEARIEWMQQRAHSRGIAFARLRRSPAFLVAIKVPFFCIRVFRAGRGNARST